MTRPGSWLLGSCALWAAALAPAAAPMPDRYPDADAAARRVDHHLEAGWKRAGVEPAAEADDSEFVRRVYLDLAGRIPTVSEARAFLADTRADRRTRLVEKLLDGPRFVTHQATLWRALLLPETNANATVGAGSFERWLMAWLESGRGVDQLARELITQPVGQRRGEVIYLVGDNASASAFFTAKEYQPEEVAGAVARVFLGVNLACAQCHNHPFASWKREQFWAFAAFFADLRAGAEKADAHEIVIPTSGKKVKAAFLDGKQPLIKAGMKSRDVLADWLVSKDNPYFARAVVNRVWAQLFGTGLVEPLDEMAGGDARASHPEVLDLLAKAFIEHKYDLKWLTRTILATRAYGLSGVRTAPGQDDARLFARAQLRGLTGHQLFDSLATATGYQGGSARGEFLIKFANAADRPTEVQSSIQQALAMMNGRLVASATSVEQSETLAAVADSPFLGAAAKVEALYLAALSRKPTKKELARLERYVEAGGVSTAKDAQKRHAEALADVFWALLNGGEFKFNH